MDTYTRARTHTHPHTHIHTHTQAKILHTPSDETVLTEASNCRYADRTDTEPHPTAGTFRSSTTLRIWVPRGSKQCTCTSSKPASRLSRSCAASASAIASAACLSLGFSPTRFCTAQSLTMPSPPALQNTASPSWLGAAAVCNANTGPACARTVVTRRESRQT